MAKLAALNAKHQMTAMYHTYAGNAVGTPVWDLLSILKDHDPAVLGFHYDVGHMVREGANGLWATNLRAAGPLRHRRVGEGLRLDARHADGRWRTDWAPLGEGLVPLDEMAAILKEIGFSGPIENQPEYPRRPGRPDRRSPSRASASSPRSGATRTSSARRSPAPACSSANSEALSMTETTVADRWAVRRACRRPSWPRSAGRTYGNDPGHRASRR